MNAPGKILATPIPSSTAILVQYWTNIQPIWNITHILAKI